MDIPKAGIDGAIEGYRVVDERRLCILVEWTGWLACMLGGIQVGIQLGQ